MAEIEKVLARMDDLISVTGVGGTLRVKKDDLVLLVSHIEALADQGKPQVTARPSDAALVDLYWKASGDDWAIPDWLMVKYGRAVLEAALGGEA